MYRFQRLNQGLAAVAVLTMSLSTSAVLAQNAPLSYAVPDAGAWSDVLKNNPKSSAPRAKKAERQKSAPAHRQAKARPAKPDAKAEAREAFASAPSKVSKTADVQVVSPDEFNEIDRMAGQ